MTGPHNSAKVQIYYFIIITQTEVKTKHETAALQQN